MAMNKLSPKLQALPTLTLKSMASGLRAMRKGQRSLLKLIEQEIKRRENDPKDDDRGRVDRLFGCRECAS